MTIFCSMDILGLLVTNVHLGLYETEVIVKKVKKLKIKKLLKSVYKKRVY